MIVQPVFEAQWWYHYRFDKLDFFLAKYFSNLKSNALDMDQEGTDREEDSMDPDTGLGASTDLDMAPMVGSIQL